jgi:exosortase
MASTLSESGEPARTDIVTRALPFAVALCAVAATWPSLSALGRYWLEVVDYQYGILIAVVSAVWFAKVAPRTFGPQSHHLQSVTLAMLSILAFFWYALWQGHSVLGAQMLTPALLWMALAAALGIRSAWPLLGPVAYLYFAIPIWDQLLPLLQQVALFGATMSMRVMGIPVSVSGINVSIAEGTFQVLYECSGLRFLMVSLALVVLYSVLDGLSRGKTIALLLIAAALAIVANWTRIFIVMYAGHLTKMEHYFVSGSHTGVGNAVFVVLLIAILLVGRRLGRDDVSQTDTGSPIAHESPALWVPAASIGVLLVLTASTTYAAWRTPVGAKPQLQPLPVPHTAWQGPMPASEDWKPRFGDDVDSRRVSYWRSSVPAPAMSEQTAERVEVFINVYGVQEQGKELVYFENTTAPAEWTYVRGRSGAVSTELGIDLSIAEYSSARNQRWLVGQTYVVGGRAVSTGLGEQLLYGLSTLTGAAPAGVIAVAVRCAESCDQAHGALIEFWREVGEQLVETLPTRMVSVTPPSQR